MKAVHAHLPKPHDPYTDLVPPQGIKLTPQHYAYLKIAEGCNHRCTFCIIPSMRGDLVSRPIGEVMQEAENLVKAGVKELLVISQDTSAYGVDVKYRTGFVGGKPVKTRMTRSVPRPGRAGSLGAAALRLSVPARRRSHPADGRGKNPSVPRRAVPACEPAHPQADEAPGERREGARARSRLARRSAPTSPSAPPSSSAFREKPKMSSRNCSIFSRKRSSTASAASSIRRSTAPRRTRCPIRLPDEVKRQRKEQFMKTQEAISAKKLQAQGRPDHQGAGRRARRRPLERGRAGNRRRGALQGRQGGRIQGRDDRSCGRARSLRETAMSNRRSGSGFRRAHRDRRLRRRAQGAGGDQAGRGRDQGSGGAREDRAGARRPCRHGQRDPRRGEGHVSLARRGDRGRDSGRHAVPDRQPAVRLGPAGDRLGGAAPDARRLRRRRRRRRREHEPRRVFPARRALGPAHGRRDGGRRDDRRAARPVRPRPHGRDRGEHRGEVRLHAPAAGRIFLVFAQESRQGDGGGLLQVADRADRAQDAQRRRAVHRPTSTCVRTRPGTISPS